MKSIAKQAVKKILQHSEKTVGLFIVTLLLLTSFFILNQSVEAQQLVCPMRAIQQITDETAGVSSSSSINADGTRIAFLSDANINGGNPEGNSEIWLANATTGIITQITDETAGISVSPSINADGTRIAFQSDANINGGNPDGNREIYLFDTTTGIFTQITDETAGISVSPSINADGMRITFTSTADINGGNPEGNREVYLFNSTTGIITQITDETAGGSLTSSINADGTRIAFDSSANINGGNPDGNREIYLFDTTTGIFTQITDETAGGSGLPSINADGTRITFNSSANINGGNPEGNIEIYLFDTTTGIITQITDETAGNSFASSINADGTRIAFNSSANINGGNPDGNDEIYLFDTTTGIFTQITDETAGNSTVSSINTDGTRIAFQSRANINGGNPDGNDEIYLAVCLDPTTARNIPTLSEWGLIAMAGVLGIIGLFAIRRRKAAAV
jgi:Tol biopolymer transport system component